MPRSKSKTALLILAILAALGIIFVVTQKRETDEQVVCTQDAKMCPDGTGVGRVPPKCEFASCPVAQNPQDYGLMKAYAYIDAKQAIMYAYPRTLGTKYITTAAWPLKAWATDDSFSCGPSPAGPPPSVDETKERIIKGRMYCVRVTNDGAAGSVYSNYSYYTEKDGKLFLVHFILRYPQCGNYADPDKTACEQERTAFDVDALATDVMNTAQFATPPVIVDKMVPGSEVYSPLTIRPVPK